MGPWQGDAAAATEGVLPVRRGSRRPRQHSQRREAAPPITLRAALGLLLAVALLSACRSAPHAALAPSAGHELDGNASWYGPGFIGRATASGEIFSGADFTAAHRTLPLGSRVRVEVVGSSEAVDVRINDRGPFVSGRVIDLSEAAARAIGLVRAGVLPVRLRVLQLGDDRRTPAPAPRTPCRLQLGAFASYENARLLRERLAVLLGAAVEVEERAGIYRIFAGPYPDCDATRDDRQRAAAAGVEGVISPSSEVKPEGGRDGAER